MVRIVGILLIGAGLLFNRPAGVEATDDAVPTNQMMGNDNLYCRYVIEHGGDWNVIEVAHPAATLLRP